MANKNEGGKVPIITHPQYGGALTSDLGVLRGPRVEPQLSGLITAVFGQVGRKIEEGEMVIMREGAPVAVGETLHFGAGIKELTMPVADSPSREEVNAKLEAVEARLDGKLAGIEAKIDVMIGGQASLRDDMKDVRNEVKSSRSLIVGAGIGLAALILGFFAFGVQILELAAGIFAAGGGQ